MMLNIKELKNNVIIETNEFKGDKQICIYSNEIKMHIKRKQSQIINYTKRCVKEIRDKVMNKRNEHNVLL